MSHTWPQSRPDLQTVGVTWRLPVGDQQPTRSVTTSFPSGLSECSDCGCVLAGPDPATHRGSFHRPHLHTTGILSGASSRLGAPALPPSPTFVQLPALSLPLVWHPQPPSARGGRGGGQPCAQPAPARTCLGACDHAGLPHAGFLVVFRGERLTGTVSHSCSRALGEIPAPPVLEGSGTARWVSAGRWLGRAQ